jgi:hypothetical protein
MMIFPAQQQDDGMTDNFRRSVLLREELQRLHRIEGDIREIYGSEVEMASIMDHMLDELDSHEVQDLIT